MSGLSCKTATDRYNKKHVLSSLVPWTLSTLEGKAKIPTSSSKPLEIQR